MVVMLLMLLLVVNVVAPIIDRNRDGTIPPDMSFSQYRRVAKHILTDLKQRRSSGPCRALAPEASDREHFSSLEITVVFHRAFSYHLCCALLMSPFIGTIFERSSAASSHRATQHDAIL
jgi:hypothetical protein